MGEIKGERNKNSCPSRKKKNGGKEDIQRWGGKKPRVKGQQKNVWKVKVESAPLCNSGGNGNET